MLPLASTQQQHMAMARRALARADNLAKSQRPRRAAAKRRCPLLVPSHLLYAIITASPRVLVLSHHPAELLAMPKPRRPRGRRGACPPHLFTATAPPPRRARRVVASAPPLRSATPTSRRLATVAAINGGG